MSIRIDSKKCIGCSKCLEVCPGSLIYKDNDGKAYNKYKDLCWGCTACLKECPVQAIKYYLGADIGGKGTTLYIEKEQQFLHWHIEKPNGEIEVITIDSTKSNKY